MVPGDRAEEEAVRVSPEEIPDGCSAVGPMVSTIELNGTVASNIQLIRGGCEDRVNVTGSLRTRPPTGSGVRTVLIRPGGGALRTARTLPPDFYYYYFLIYV